MKINEPTFNTFAVRRELEAGLAAAGVRDRRIGAEQAEVLAGAGRARVRVLRLQRRVVHVDGQRLRDEVRHHGLVDAAELVRRQHAVQLAVGPVQRVLEQSQGMRVQQVVASRQHLLPSRAVVVAEVYEVQLGVGEVHSLRRRIERQPVGPVDLGGDDGQSLGAVHADAFDPGVLPPVGPEEPARIGSRVQAHAARLRDVAAEQRRARSAVLLGHLDSVQFAVQPVDVSSDPVVGEALDEVQSGGHDHFGLGAAVQPGDLLQFHVGPEDGSGVHVGGGGDDVLHVDGDPLEALLVEVGDEDGVAVGDDEEGAGVVVGLAGVLVSAQPVAVDAAAVVGLLDVGAELRAGAGRRALVHIAAREAVGLQLLARGAQAQRAQRGGVALVGAQPRLVLALGRLARRACGHTRVTAGSAARHAGRRGRYVPSSAPLGQSKLLSHTCVRFTQRLVTPGHCQWPAGHLQFCKIVIRIIMRFFLK